jgi:hypothetical protein
MLPSVKSSQILPYACTVVSKLNYLSQRGGLATVKLNVFIRNAA